MKKSTKKNIKKNDDKVNNILLIIFILLTIVVISLIIKLVSIKLDNKIYPNTTIPIVEKDSSNNIGIQIGKMNGKEEYILDISNYRDSNILKNISYKMEITNKDNADISIYKNDKKIDITNNNLIVIEEKLGSKKDYDRYKIILNSKNNINNKSLLDINIYS